MGLYRAELNFDQCRFGQVYDIPEADLPAWANEIEDGFLVKVESKTKGPTDDTVVDIPDLVLDPVTDDAPAEDAPATSQQ